MKKIIIVLLSLLVLYSSVFSPLSNITYADENDITEATENITEEEEITELETENNEVLEVDNDENITEIEIESEESDVFVVEEEIEIEEVVEEAELMATGYIPDDAKDYPLTSVELNGKNRYANNIPSSYSLRAEGSVTSVKNQGRYGTCWAHAFMASAESTMLKGHGYDVDLSELALAWYTYKMGDVQDKLGNYNEAFEQTRPSVLDCGGNSFMALETISLGVGFVLEEDLPYSLAGNAANYLANRSDLCYESDAFEIAEFREYPLNTADRINKAKQAIMENGAMVISYYSDSSTVTSKFFNKAKASYYSYGHNSTNHAVTVVGWDDNYSRNNFVSNPGVDGAWLVKNSWGTAWGDGGYFWLSYADESIEDAVLYQVFMRPTDRDTLIYANWDAKVVANGRTNFVYIPDTDIKLNSVYFECLKDTSYTLSVNVYDENDVQTVIYTQEPYYADVYSSINLQLKKDIVIKAGQKFNISIEGKGDYNYKIVDTVVYANPYIEKEEFDNEEEIVTTRIYKVLFDINGGDSGQINPMINNGYVTIPSSGFTKKGYKLVGFNDKADGSGNKYELGQTAIDLVNNDDVVLYAMWEANSYQIKFVDEVVLDEYTMDVHYGDVVKKLPTLVKEGYVFEGWLNDGSLVDGNIVYEYEEDLTLTAKWSKEVHEAKSETPSLIEVGSPIILSSETAGATIYYTIDGTLPSKDSMIYDGPIVLDASILGEEDSVDVVVRAIVIKEDGAVSEEVEFSFTIVREIVVERNGLWTLGLEDFYEYTGKAIIPTFEVYFGNNKLTLGVDYTLSFKNNNKVGTALITIKGKGNYAGTIVKSFEVVSPKDNRINAIKFNVKAANANYSDIIDGNYNGVVVKNGKDILVEGKDYIVEYPEVMIPGNNVIYIRGINDYCGFTKATLKINKYDIGYDINDVISYDVRYDGGDFQYYSKDGAKPNLSLYFDDYKLVYNKDYSIVYSNNKAIGMASMTIKGKGNYSGSLTLNYEVKPADLSALTMTANDVVFKNAKGNFKTAVKVLDNGKPLNVKELTQFTYTYLEDCTVFSYEINDYIDVKAGEEVNALHCLSANTAIVVKANSNSPYYVGEISTVYRVVSGSISSAKAIIPVFFYTGSDITPKKEDMVVLLGKDTLSSDDYEIISYSRNLNKGNATLTIRGLGNYGGIKTFNFKINPCMLFMEKLKGN